MVEEPVPISLIFDWDPSLLVVPNGMEQRHTISFKSLRNFLSTNAVQEEIHPTIGSVKFKTDLKEEV